MKNQTNNSNSLFVEVKEDEAANVNGGTIGFDISDAFGGFSTASSYFLYQSNQSLFYDTFGYDGYSYVPWGYSYY